MPPHAGSWLDESADQGAMQAMQGGMQQGGIPMMPGAMATMGMPGMVPMQGEVGRRVSRAPA